MPEKTKMKTVLLMLAVFWLVVAVILPCRVFAFQVMEGRLTDIRENRITLDGYRTFEPANEHAVIPEWAEEGVQVKVSYYVQGYTNYYLKIVLPGESLLGEEGQKVRAPR